MKSGIAAHLVVLKYLSEHRDSFTGNILFMANPIEETTHRGIIDALSELERMQKEKNSSLSVQSMQILWEIYLRGMIIDISILVLLVIFLLNFRLGVMHVG